MPTVAAGQSFPPQQWYSQQPWSPTPMQGYSPSPYSPFNPQHAIQPMTPFPGASAATNWPCCSGLSYEEQQRLSPYPMQMGANAGATGLAWAMGAQAAADAAYTMPVRRNLN